MASEEPEVVEIDGTNKTVEQLVQELLDMETKGLTEAQVAMRSLALFPQTHTSTVKIMGADRELRPLPIKYTRMLNKELHGIRGELKKAFAAEEAVVIDDRMLEALKKGVNVMCQFYGESWKDIQADLVAEEQLSSHDLQILCNIQQRIQGANDFLLAGLRLVIKMMQLAETLQIKQGMVVTNPSSFTSEQS